MSLPHKKAPRKVLANPERWSTAPQSGPKNPLSLKTDRHILKIEELAHRRKQSLVHRLFCREEQHPKGLRQPEFIRPKTKIPQLPAQKPVRLHIDPDTGAPSTRSQGHRTEIVTMGDRTHHASRPERRTALPHQNGPVRGHPQLPEELAGEQAPRRKFAGALRHRPGHLGPLLRKKGAWIRRQRIHFRSHNPVRQHMTDKHGDLTHAYKIRLLKRRRHPLHPRHPLSKIGCHFKRNGPPQKFRWSNRSLPIFADPPDPIPGAGRRFLLHLPSGSERAAGAREG